MRKILIAADEYFGKCLAGELRNEYDARRCSDGSTALRLLEQLRPEGLVLRLDLSGMDGMEVLARAAYRPPVTIVITPLINDGIIQELERQGVAYVLATPCKVSSVVAALKQLIMEEGQLEGLK